MERPSALFRISSVIFRCQKYVKKGYIEMTKKIYLETLKSVLGRSILHYHYCADEGCQKFLRLGSVAIITGNFRRL